MAKRALEKITAGVEDAIAYANGDTIRGRVGGPSTGVDVAAIRRQTGKTQDQFARAFRLPIGTVRDWEQGRSRPDATARVLLSLIDAEPELIERLVQSA